MEIKGSKLLLVKEAVMTAMMSSRNESKDAEYALLLVDIEGGIERDKQIEENVEKIKSLEGCVFHYCGEQPKCVGKCIHKADSQ